MSDLIERLPRRLLFAALIGLSAGLVLLPADAQESGGWRLGVAQVPDAPAPGAKPRTLVRLEALAAQAVPDSAPLQALTLDQALERLQADQLDAWVGIVPEDAALPGGVQRRALAWSASPMAILRVDTDIHDWTALAGRTVCLSADGRFVGELNARFAAIEQVYPSATDALLALRTGQCDAAVQDEDFLRQLLTYPEWRKFSAQLQPYRKLALAQLRRADLPVSGRQALQQALSAASLQHAVQEQVKAIAFEVYLDQTVPDCH
ncbi:transporter substrate-binding domain-containing protein [Castellaniella sp.]|uniref:transporter substrate-binding domain-containing protein n=1 Tax=Castellaniella sp. TaxID=1955812 RepID=UPI002AFFC8E5|nr:transporter substrate-binding domain-containing protein [Castellaniella sp.]